MITKTGGKDGFSPVQLQNGISQMGDLSKDSSKYYYFKTSADAPIYATLIPNSGNPDFSVAVIKDLTLSID